MSNSSEIHFKNFNYKSPKERACFQLLKEVKGIIPVKSKKDALKIISGTASMGIRGTKPVNNRTDKMGNNIVQWLLEEKLL